MSISTLPPPARRKGSKKESSDCFRIYALDYSFGQSLSLYSESAPIAPKEPKLQPIPEKAPVDARIECDYGYAPSTDREKDERLVFIDEDDEEWVEDEDISDFICIYFSDTLRQR